MVENRGRDGSRHYARSAIVLAVTMSLVGCGTLSFLPRQSDAGEPGFKSFQEIQKAYARVEPGVTRASQLGALGFTSGAGKTLSYLGVIERFMPRDTVHFDALSPAVQECIAARNGCSAYVYHPEGGVADAGERMLGALGLARKHSPGVSGELVLLIENGRVAYKAMRDATGALLQTAANQTGTTAQ
jgi:hypothetical protein